VASTVRSSGHVKMLGGGRTRLAPGCLSWSSEYAPVSATMDDLLFLLAAQLSLGVAVSVLVPSLRNSIASLVGASTLIPARQSRCLTQCAPRIPHACFVSECATNTHVISRTNIRWVRISIVGRSSRYPWALDSRTSMGAHPDNRRYGCYNPNSSQYSHTETA
jgi:hypothetical protein